MLHQDRPWKNNDGFDNTRRGERRLQTPYSFTKQHFDEFKDNGWGQERTVVVPVAFFFLFSLYYVTWVRLTLYNSQGRSQPQKKKKITKFDPLEQYQSSCKTTAYPSVSTWLYLPLSNIINIRGETSKIEEFNTDCDVHERECRKLYWNRSTARLNISCTAFYKITFQVSKIWCN